MRIRPIAAATAAVALAGGVAVAAAGAADAATTYSCTATQYGWPTLHASATRINYGGGRTAIVAKADQQVVKVITLAPDPVYTFHSFTSPGLQSRYSQPTQWGSSTNFLDTTTREITVTWTGRVNNTTLANRSCTMRVAL